MKRKFQAIKFQCIHLHFTWLLHILRQAIEKLDDVNHRLASVTNALDLNQNPKLKCKHTANSKRMAKGQSLLPHVKSSVHEGFEENRSRSKWFQVQQAKYIFQYLFIIIENLKMYKFN